MASLKHDFAGMLNSLRVELPGSSDAGIKQVMFDVLQEWFEDTQAWLEDISFVTASGTATYDLLSPNFGQTARLVSLAKPTSDPNRPVYLPATLSPDRTQIILRDTPTEVVTLTATIQKTVELPITRDALPEVPDTTLQLYGQYIKDGVLARMMMQRSKPFTDPQTAAYHMKRFSRGKRDARSAALHQNTFGTNTWAFPQAWRVRGQRGGVSTRLP
jgi:hypothetical protein